jgi:hypothetical protein
MISWTYEIVGTGEKRDALGPDPRGWIVYTPERVMVLVLKSDRKNLLDLCQLPGKSLRFTTLCLLTLEPIPSIPTA